MSEDIDREEYPNSKLTIVKKILLALEGKYNKNILNFSNYKIEEELGQGQQGIVLRIRNKIRKLFALKIYDPKRGEDPKILKDVIENFMKEVKNLVTLNHKNIVKIFTGGTAEWKDESQWEVDESFPENKVKDIENENIIFFYIMNFIEGSELGDVFPILKHVKNEQEWKKYHGQSNYDHIILFEKLITQTCNALIYHHEKKITHKDLKSENILFNKQDSNFIIVDYGFAKHYTSAKLKGTIIRTEYLDMASIEANNYELNDMGQFSKILYYLLPFFKNQYEELNYQGIQLVIDRGKNEKLNQRFDNMTEYYNSIKHNFITEINWKFQVKLDGNIGPNNFGRFNSKLRIPVSGSILLTDEVRKLIDTKEFQRLRGVRQLGPTIEVYPGANHTRFEHSLGTYHLSLKYLEKLLRIPAFREVCLLSDKSIKYFILSALLHDIGHYPYSHWIEEMDFEDGISFLKHEERAGSILKKKRIKDIIENVWKVDINILSQIIKGDEIYGEQVVMNSLINSIIDVDKMDYLVRDSIHCGVDYGKGIDIERFLDSLFYLRESKKITLTEKGRTLILSLLACRNILYTSVYWHKTVRACEAMFKRYFFEYVKIKKNHLEEIKNLFKLSDDHFILKCYEGLKDTHKHLSNLIKPFAFGKGPRVLYKAIYIHYFSGLYDEKTQNFNTKKFFNSLIEHKYVDLVKISNALVGVLKNDIPALRDHDILIEKTPIKPRHESYGVDQFQFWDQRHKRLERIPEVVKNLDKYLDQYKQVYIFCNPRYYQQLKKIFLDDNRRENALVNTKKIFELTKLLEKKQPKKADKK